jgi:hypothetical protein
MRCSKCGNYFSNNNVCRLCAKYRKQRLYTDCQLISAINAKIALTGEDVSEDEYERLLYIAQCRYKGAKNVHNTYHALGLTFVDLPLNLENIVQNIPAEITLSYGDNYHSALIVWWISKECDSKGKGIYEFKIVNHHYGSTISSVELQKFMPKNTSCRRLRHFRLFDDCTLWSPAYYIHTRENIRFH